MPRVDTEVQHVALTHHRIGLHTKRRNGNRRHNGRLEAMQDLSHLQEADRWRAFGLAYLRMVTKAVPDPTGIPQFRLAVTMLQNAYSNGIRDADTLAALATVHRITGQLSKAEEFARKALNTKPISPGTRYDALEILAEVQDRTGKTRKAVATLRELVKLGRNPLHFFILALNEKRLGRRDRAIAALQKAIHIHPGWPQAHREIAPLLRERGDVKQAQWHQRRANTLSVEPKNNGAAKPPPGDENCSKTQRSQPRQRTRDPP